MPRYSHPDFTFNRSAIMTEAWARAHYAAKAYKLPIRTALAEALQRVWGIAKQERDIKRWQAAKEANAAAEAARRAALPRRHRLIEDARTDLLMAEHNDTAIGNRLVAEARTRLRSLQHAA